jgi:hypothetical protein
MGLCRLALLRKDFATARRICSQNWKQYRDFAFVDQMVAQVEFFARNFPEAESMYENLAAKDPNGGGAFYGAMSYRSALGRLRLLANDEKGGREILEACLQKEFDALRAVPGHPETLYRVAAIESSLGQTRNALVHIEEAVNAGWIDYRSLSLDPRFDTVASDPRFKKILATLAKKVEELRLKAGGNENASKKTT